MRNVKLFTSVAVAALIAGAPAAFAQNIIQDPVNNSADVSTGNSGMTIGGDVDGTAASGSISTTGAAASVGVLGVNTSFISPGSIGNIRQVVNNSGEVKTRGPSSSNPITINQAGEVSGTGSSLGISSSGAIAAVSVTGINSGSNQTIANVTQDTANSNRVENAGGSFGRNRIETEGVSGRGASVSISSTGAASSVSGTFINDTGGGSFSVATGGRISQETTHTTPANGDVQTAGTIDDIGDDGAAAIRGDGASVSISATGAVSAVSARFISSEGQADFGDVFQTTRNNGPSSSLVTTDNSDIDGSGNVGSGFTVSGDGASVSISATGAASSVSVSGINQTATGRQTVGNVVQDTRTTQASEVNNGASNINAIKRLNGISGDGASVSISATGSASSVSLSQINSNNNVALESRVGNVDQTTITRASEVTNVGRIANKDPDGITGDAASLSISATGAVSAVSASFVNSTEIALLDVGNISQFTQNDAAVTNTNVSTGGSPSDIDTGDITGNGASVSVSATGAASSASVTSIDNRAKGGTTPNITLGSVSQETINTGAVTNNGGVVTTGDLVGTGSRVQISATGAASMASIASINGQQPLGSTNIGNVNQSTTNTAAVTNSGTINVGGLTQTGTSASISATGAAASTSFSAID